MTPAPQSAAAQGRARIEHDVAAKVTPSAAEDAALQAVAAALCARADARLGELKIPGRAAIQGSVAKGTWLRGGADLDLFLLLDASVPQARLDSIAGDVGKAFLEGAQRKYAQHPYLQGTFQGHAVDLVPAYAVASAAARMSAVDRTPFHTAWVQTHLTAAQRADVRVLKRWLKGTGLYGADTATGGFSGYLVEVLVAAHATMDGVLRWLAAAAKPRRITLGADEVKDDVSPLVVVDPVDPARNCAAAVTDATLDRAAYAANAYLAAPTERFYFPAAPRAESAALLHDALGKQNVHWNAILLDAQAERLDIVLPQFHRAARTIAAALDDAGFPVRRHDVAAQGQSVLLQFVTSAVTLPATRRHRGPRADAKPNADRFAAKWNGHPDAVGPAAANAEGDMEVEVRVTQRTAADLVRALRGDALGRHVQDAWPGRRTLADPADAPPHWAPAVADVVLDRRPWQR